VHDERQGVHWLAVHEHVELDEPRRAVADLLVVHRRVALAAALQLVEVVDDQLASGMSKASRTRVGSRYSMLVKVPRRFVDSS